MLKKKTAILIIHGIGIQSSDYAEKLVAEFTNEDVKCFPFMWHDILSGKETSYNINLPFKKLRKFILLTVGDAAGYQIGDDDYSYENIHRRLDDKLKEIQEWLNGGKLIIIGHSLGSIIINNFIYNVQHEKSGGNSIYKSNLPGDFFDNSILFTLGSPLLLYTIGKSRFTPIRVAQWINVICPTDFIAYPIRDINNEHKVSYIKDIKCYVGHLWVRFTPLSHMYYTEDKKIFSMIRSTL